MKVRNLLRERLSNRFILFFSAIFFSEKFYCPTLELGVAQSAQAIGKSISIASTTAPLTISVGGQTATPINSSPQSHQSEVAQESIQQPVETKPPVFSFPDNPIEKLPALPVSPLIEERHDALPWASIAAAPFVHPFRRSCHGEKAPTTRPKPEQKNLTINDSELLEVLTTTRMDTNIEFNFFEAQTDGQNYRVKIYSLGNLIGHQTSARFDALTLIESQILLRTINKILNGQEEFGLNLLRQWVAKIFLDPTVSQDFIHQAPEGLINKLQDLEHPEGFRTEISLRVPWGSVKKDKVKSVYEQLIPQFNFPNKTIPLMTDQLYKLKTGQR